MSKGLWPAISGSVAQSERLDTIANNLANSDTNGFKKDQVAFRSIMSSAVTAAMKEEIPRKPYMDKDFHRLDGADKAYVAVDGAFTDFAQGRAKVTGSPLDVALEGNGFLEVLSPQGVRYTRQGSLRINQEGSLVTTDGFPVLNSGGQEAAGGAPVPREELLARAIQLNPAQGGKVTITTDGRIFQGQQEAAQLSVVEFIDPRLLQKEGNSLFRNENTANLSGVPSNTSVKQGMLETSNVNAVAEMAELLKATRMFEANEKIVRTYGDLESRAVNELGKL
jgi:flagellar basal-body rod protein FlgF